MTLTHTAVTQLVHDLSSGKLKRDPNARLRVPCIGVKQLEAINERKHKQRMRDILLERQREREAMYSMVVAGNGAA